MENRTILRRKKMIDYLTASIEEIEKDIQEMDEEIKKL